MLFNKKVGILGGGQLGAMLIRSAIDFGLDVAVMDSDTKAPAARYTNAFFAGDTTSYEAVMAFGKDLDIITIEKEHVNTKALRALQQQGKAIYPSPETIEIIQDKYLQKQFMAGCGIPVVPGVAILNRKDLEEHIARFPACLKKCRSGYDGKGVMVLHTVADIQNAFDEACVLEDLIDIQYELSVIVSRNKTGAIACYEPVKMVFKEGQYILDYQVCPADISEEEATAACNIAKKIAAQLELTGILAVEMFVTKEGQLVVNELAPRPHNSGHHTIETCPTSQYEQLIRTILDLAPGETATTRSSVMINLLEQTSLNETEVEQQLKSLMSIPGTHLHWYGKKERREGRKSGHITITEEKIETALSTADNVRKILKN